MKRAVGVAIALSIGLSSPAMSAEVKKPAALSASRAKLEKELVAKHGEGQRERLRRGLEQVSRFWRSADGNAKAFEEFVTASFAGDQATLDALFSRMEF